MISEKWYVFREHFVTAGVFRTADPDQRNHATDEARRGKMRTVIDRLAASVATRRGSLALGSVALLGLTRAPRAEADNSCKKKCKKKVDKACGKQVDECRAIFLPGCSVAPNPTQCEDTVKQCCAPLGDCDFSETITCLGDTVL